MQCPDFHLNSQIAQCQIVKLTSVPLFFQHRNILYKLVNGMWLCKMLQYCMLSFQRRFCHRMLYVTPLYVFLVLQLTCFYGYVNVVPSFLQFQQPWLVQHNKHRNTNIPWCVTEGISCGPFKIWVVTLLWIINL